MGTFIEVGLAIIIGLVLVELAFKALGGGIRDFAVITRWVMELFGVGFSPFQTRRERLSMIVMTLLIAAGVASCLGLLVHWAFFS